MLNSKKQIGSLSPRYSFAINRYRDARFSKCLKCNGTMNIRKFPLFIHVDGWGPVALGKTCRYCHRCELIIAHQDELETQLLCFFQQHSPERIGNDYLVLGTVQFKFWKESLEKNYSLLVSGN